MMKALAWLALPLLGVIGLPTHAMDWRDQNVSIQDDFYHYANGGWLKTIHIPPTHSSWSVFSIVEDHTLHRLHKLMRHAALQSHTEAHRPLQIIGDYYASAMNHQVINAQGSTPLNAELAKINAIHDAKSLQNQVEHMHQLGINVLFQFSSMQDFKNSSRMIGVLMQGGLTLPDRDYYLGTEPQFIKIRAAYRLSIQRMLALVGESPRLASQDADTILRIETRLAQHAMSRIQQRQPQAIYHMMSVQQLNVLAPRFVWSTYFSHRGQPHLTQLNVAMPEFIQGLNQDLQEVSFDEWKVYLKWHLINESAMYLSDAFVKENFRLHRLFTGAHTLYPRWRRVIQNSNLALEFALGELYVQTYFGPQSKAHVLQMMQQIRLAFKQELQNSTWMSPSTRRAALKKLAMMEERVGSPEKPWDYSSLTIDRHVSYLENTWRSETFLIHHELNKIDKPVDRQEWSMAPQAINAYYDPSMNYITIPAGILQAPFFDPKANAAANYGAIGWIIGHEMTHGFDDEGSQFDAQGNLRHWWAPNDAARFGQITQCIINQYSKYTVNQTLQVKGPLVAGEALADRGGLALAYLAFHQSNEFATTPMVDGLTPDQQFFISAAHIWAMKIRPERASLLITTDPHPPALFRVNGTMVNLPAFYRAFHLPQEKQVNTCPY